ncbi:HAD family phosphatase [Oceanihabitans sediminis]|uniref:HAD family phosphatase n=1 Tax=Oceanihabitans sediminis TaxID=1812012 RepID=A0A368P5N5_9FLAO|nr:HAD family phosphatase [Oceanihabitans sediminis]MDX1277760.1 HAD family phosphatase [Oceanihabitans sediminis]MDX1774808.1 HAD family phosphatase [Oceanihabitans sediminis]RBP32691.1 putative hydrolase of the HAD superfamily [Oceanihabitans sediminis]RCU57766.1 HAD family phosphatase [Oceanihabitans sediminis]
MIKTLIFDFGDVFINLDKAGAMQNALDLFEEKELPEELVAINTLYEQGLLETEEFVSFYKENFPKLSEEEIIDAWNYILKDFPTYRLEFIQKLASEKKHKLILLSNTNELHINWIKEKVSFYEDFKKCFDAFYLSHEIQLRKPNSNIYEFVLNENNIKPEESLFIDDTKENTEAARELGIHVWNIDETKEDVIHLFNIKKELF